jgi:DNA modification methylase
MARKPTSPVSPPSLAVEMLPLASLRPHPRNYRTHGPEQLAHIKASLTTHGYYRNIVLAKDATILAGHGVVLAAQELGWSEGPCLRLPLAPDHPLAIKVLVGDNEIAALGFQETPTLVALLQELQDDPVYDLLGTGFDEAMLAALAGETPTETGASRDAEPQIDRAEELREEWGTAAGQVWTLGKHRLICGDCTDDSVLQRLLQGQTPDILINDPPYGMRLDADFSDMTSKPQFARDKGAFGGRRYANVHGDHEDFDAGPVVEAMQAVREQFWFGADYYAKSLGDTQHEGAWFVWDKRLDETMDKMYGSCFELLWSRQKHKRMILRHKWAGIFGTEHEDQRGRLHPNQKPVRLYEDLLTRFSAEHALVIDCFVGSGTMMIACENLQRRCYACEIDPGYVAVTLQRYADATGQRPTLEA